MGHKLGKNFSKDKVFRAPACREHFFMTSAPVLYPAIPCILQTESLAACDCLPFNSLQLRFQSQPKLSFVIGALTHSDSSVTITDLILKDGEEQKKIKCQQLQANCFISPERKSVTSLLSPRRLSVICIDPCRWMFGQLATSVCSFLPRGTVY